MGVCVPKNIPMKLASIRKSMDKDHLKHSFEPSLFEKSTTKKVYIDLHKIVKGAEEEQRISNKMSGPMEAPG